MYDTGVIQYDSLQCPVNATLYCRYCTLYSAVRECSIIPDKRYTQEMAKFARKVWLCIISIQQTVR